MRLNLSKKLFIITLSLLLGLMGFTLIFQTFIFEDFYINKKTNSLIKNINQFKFLNSYKLDDSKGLYQALSKFEEENGAKIAIFSLNGKIKFLPNNENVISYDEEILIDFCKQILENKDLVYSILSSNKTISTSFSTDHNQRKNIGVVSAISINSHNDSLVISVAPLQPIFEASDVINEFYFYIFIGVIFISIILSSIYTNLITKPLLKINTVATKMCKMNFEEKCVINRSDEIGNLARTLNFLSLNLNNALLDLRKKNEKLKEDIEKERQLEIMRKDFIASVSHELKTPVGIIEGYAEGIKDGIVSGDDADKYLEIIIDESKKMSTLVSNMLELSKLESGVIKPTFEIFNINRLIKKVVKTFELDCLENGLTIKFIPHTEYSYVNADIFQMEQVLTNLITNAIKYTPKNNSIFLSIEEIDKTYYISVLNTGSEIPEDENENVFNKFYRLDKSHNRDNNSSGLGLSIVKNILDLHHSEYNIKNVPDGVKFTFSLNKEDIPSDLIN